MYDLHSFFKGSSPFISSVLITINVNKGTDIFLSKDMYIIQIDNKFLTVTTSMSILEACLLLKKQVPSYCYHPDLVLEGNCRMCLVEIDKMAKPQASCSLPIQHNMKIFTNTPFVKKARENVMEFLLLNHPLDCPICDQGGECDLQDQALSFGSLSSRYRTTKRNLTNKYYNKYLKIIMNRCITCTRCIRYISSVTGTSILGTLKRGFHTEVGSFTSTIIDTPFSGNLIELCPVGAITSKPQAFLDRPWETVVRNSFDFTDNLGTPIRIETRKNELLRITPKTSNATIEYISNRIRFMDVNSYLVQQQKITRKINKIKVINKNLKFSFFLLTAITKNILIPFNFMLNRESLLLISNLFSKKFLKNFQSDLYNTSLSSLSSMFLFNYNRLINKTNLLLCIGMSPYYTNSKLFLKLLKEQMKRHFALYSVGNVSKYNDSWIQKSALQSCFLNLNISSFIKHLSGLSNLSKLYSESKSLVFLFKLQAYLKTNHIILYQIINQFITNLKSNNQASSYILKTYQSSLNQTGILSYGLQKKYLTQQSEAMIHYMYNTQNIQVSLNNSSSAPSKKTSFVIPNISTASFFETEGSYQTLNGIWKLNSPCINYNQNQLLSSTKHLAILSKKYIINSCDSNKIIYFFTKKNQIKLNLIFNSQQLCKMYKKMGSVKKPLENVVPKAKFSFQYQSIPFNIFKTVK